MKTGLFADIHANREALEACLRHAEANQVDDHIFLGDLVGYGADPSWVIDTVMQYHARGAGVILGNHDAAVLSKPELTMVEDARQAIDWTRPRLTDDNMKFLSGLPLSIEKKDRLFVHSSAFKPADWSYVADVHSARKCFGATFSRFIYCGHLHQPLLYHQGSTGKVVQFTPVAGVDIPLGMYRRWLAVIGAVGQPRDSNPAACYAVHDSGKNILTYYRVGYDVTAAARKVRESGLPVWLGDRLERGV
ncbi:MAG: metallophosphoesterase [Nitrospirae bacterium]|nr:MAG: metallophosphoesterase [Nitrospirota bacterium]